MESLQSENFAQQGSSAEFKRYFTSNERIPGKGDINLLLSSDRKLSEEMADRIAFVQEFRQCKGSKYMFYLSQNNRIQVKLHEGLVYTGTRENYTDLTSRFVSFDDRIVFHENHQGITSLFCALAKAASKQLPKLINSSLVQQLEKCDDEKDRLFTKFPNAKCKWNKCPSDHQLCGKLFYDTTNGRTEFLREACSLNSTFRSDVDESNDSCDRNVQNVYPCAFLKKICRPERCYSNSEYPAGQFVLPPQFDKRSPEFLAAEAKGLRPFNYDVSQLKNLGDGDKKFIQCARCPWYAQLFSPGRKAFKVCDLAFGTFFVTGFYLESAQKLSLQLEPTDMLLVPSEGRVVKLDKHEGRFNFEPEEIGSTVLFTNDEEENGEDNAVEFGNPKRLRIA